MVEWSPHFQIVEDELRLRKKVEMSQGNDRLIELVNEVSAWSIMKRKRERREMFDRIKRERELADGNLLSAEQKMAVALRSLERVTK